MSLCSKSLSFLSSCQLVFFWRVHYLKPSLICVPRNKLWLTLFITPLHIRTCHMHITCLSHAYHIHIRACHVHITCIHTSDMSAVCRVVLTSSQEALIENFCTHLHDIWALEMLSDEWEFDEEHNESLKKHPNLVHYKQLPQEVLCEGQRTMIQSV